MGIDPQCVTGRSRDTLVTVVPSGSGGDAIRLLVSHSWRDTAIADRLAGDLSSICEVEIDVRGVRSTEPVQESLDRALTRTDAVILLWTTNTPSSPGVRAEIETASRLDVPVFPCLLEADAPSSSGLLDAIEEGRRIEFGDEVAGFALLCLALLRHRRGLEPPIPPELDAHADLDSIAGHVRLQMAESSNGEVAELGDRILTALESVKRREEEATTQLEEGMSLAQQAMDAMARQPLDRNELEAILVAITTHEREYPGLMRHLRRLVERALATLPPVQPDQLDSPILTMAPHEDRQLRTALAGVVSGDKLDDAVAAVTHYIQTAPGTIQALHDAARGHDSSAVAHAVQAAEAYFNQADDLLPDHYGILGRLDDCWLVHNLAFRAVEAGVVVSNELPSEWIRVVSADALVISLLPDEVRHGLEALTLALMNDLAEESLDYQPDFAIATDGHLEPTINRDPKWTEPAPDAIDLEAPTVEPVENTRPDQVRSEDDGAAWGSPEVSLFLGMAGLAVSMWWSLLNLDPVVRTLVCLAILIVPIPLIALGAHGLMRMMRVLTDPHRMKDLPRTVRGAREEHRAEQRRWSLRLILEMTAVVAAIAAFVFVIRPWQQGIVEAEKIATSKSLAGDADDEYVSSIGRGLFIALEAYRTHPTVEAMDAILKGLATSTHLIEEIESGPDHVVAISPDGRLLAIGYADGGIRLHDADTGQPVEIPLAGHDARITALAFSNPLGRHLISGDEQGHVREWAISSGERIFGSVIHDRGVGSISVSAAGDRVVTAGADDRISVWSRTSDGLERLSGFIEGSATIAALSPDGSTIAGAELDDVVVYDADSRDELFRFAGHTGRIQSLAFKPDGSLVASVDADGNLGWLDPGEPASGLIASLGSDPIRSISFANSASLAIAGDESGRLILLEISRRQHEVVGTFDASSESGWVDQVHLSPDAATAVAAGTEGVKLLTVAAQDRLGPIIVNPEGGSWSIAFGPSDEVLVIGAGDGAVGAWTTADYAPTGSVSVGDGAVRSIAVAPDGRMVAGSGDGDVIVWDDLHDLGSWASLGREDGAIRAVAFLGGDGDPVSGGSSGVITRWTPAPRILGRHRDGDVRAVTSSPDGRYVVSAGSDRSVQAFLWDADRDDADFLDRDLTLDRGLWAVAYHPDDGDVAFGGDDTMGRIAIWDPDSDETPTIPVDGSPGRVFALAFSPSGDVLAAAVDSGVQMWAMTSEEPSRLGPPLPGHNDVIRSITFDHEGKLLATASADGTARLWSVDPLDWVDRACRVTGRNPTMDEWEAFRPGHGYVKLCPDLPSGEDAPADAPAAKYRNPFS